MKNLFERPTLVIDSDRDFLASITGDKMAKLFPPSVANCHREARRKLLNQKKEYSGIFINPNISLEYGLSTIRLAHKFHSGTPVFLLCDDSIFRFSVEELKKLAVQKAISKPVSYGELTAIVEPIIRGFDADFTLQQAQKNQDKIYSEVCANYHDFIPIKAECFLSGSKSFFDLYIFISHKKKFLKILQSGNSFSPKSLSRYMHKGIKYFYIKKEMQESYLQYCEHLTAGLLKRKGVSRDVVHRQTMNYGEQVIHFLQQSGISQSDMQYANEFLKTLQDFIADFPIYSSQELSWFLAETVEYEHGIATSIIAQLLIMPPEINSELTRKNIILASLFQDVGVYYLPEELRTMNLTEMSEYQLDQYYQHPELSAKMLEKIRGVNPAVIQAVRQHHERRNGRGYPNRLISGQINYIAEIIGISGEFANLIKRAKNDDSIDMVKELKENIFHGFSLPIIRLFQKRFKFLKFY